ncbi:MAG: N-acetyl-gamma-glutamyl-phosphate reductase [Bacillota bacterium]|nr:N-acetyl-gamma-glutamyl-phosphate reductase [Bacillota bacterium]
MKSKTKVFIDGREGTTGLRIYSRLEQREDVELLSITDEERRKDAAARREMIRGADVVFLCLPDQAARESVALAAEFPSVRIIDASTAHRTEPGWSYGFPELSPALRESIVNGSRVAVPGCHASGFVALVRPLVKAGLLPAGSPLACFSVTGYSGGGKKMIAEYEAADRPLALSSPRQYALGQEHKHLKEMKAICGLEKEPLFSPIVADFYSGMVVTVPLHRSQFSSDLGPEGLRQVYEELYGGQKLVRVLPEGDEGFLAGNVLSGSDAMEIAVAGNRDRMILTARFDNLGKGASGAALQCLNLMTGAEETAGLQL